MFKAVRMLCKFALLTLLACCYATPPPGYVKPPEVDKYPPKYEYGYTIQDNKGSGQGKLESREGVFSLGSYFVQLGGPKGASQNVQYITDEWGYHPLVEYSSIGDHSQTSTQFALGEKAVEALRKNTKTQILSKDQPSKISQVHVPSPMQSTKFALDISTTVPPLRPKMIQSSSIPTAQTKLPELRHSNQDNIPLLQNTIPFQYILPFNFPQAQFLIQPQAEPLPQSQFLIQDQNTPQQFIIPLYDTGLNSPQVHQVNLNLLPTPQTFVNDLTTQTEQNKNVNFEQQIASNHQKQTDGNVNLEMKKDIAATSIEDKKVSFIVNENNKQTQHNVNIPKQEVETIQLNNINKQNNKYQENFNNGQYLIEIKQQQPQSNIVLLPQTIQDNKIVIQNTEQIEKSTLTNDDKLKQENEEIEYLAQAIQNDLNLQNTEPLFGNIASEVKYTSNRNSASSNKFGENTFDESILDIENPGGYGSRIKVKKTNIKNNQDIGSRLIDRTRNLVTGVDVLNINDAITNYVATASAEAQSGNKNGVKEYSPGNNQYGYNENVPNTVLEAVSNYNNKNIQDQEETAQNSNNENVVQQAVENYQSESLESTSSGNQQNNLIASSSTYSSEANAIHNTRNKLLEILNAERVQNQKDNLNDHISLSDQPIIVAELENYQENNILPTSQQSLAETVYSTTQNTVETKIIENNIVSTESPVLITPRPVSNNFLAPITAAVSLQNSDPDVEDLKKDNYAPETSVEIQKSVPYYLGKLEFVESQEDSQQSSEEELLSTKLIIQKQNNENETNEENQNSEEQNNYPKAEALIQSKNQNNLNVPDQISEQDESKQEVTALELKHSLSEDSSAEVQESKIVNKPVEVTKIIEKPYPVEVPIGIPYAVEKKVPIEVEKIIEKPVHVTKIVEKPVPVHIPQPYPVEVEKIVEKQVRIPIEVTKYVNNPYPVHIPYPEPVAVPVEVERLVQTVVKEPYPVEVPVPVEIPIKISVPHPVQVTKYIDKPYPVEKIIEKPIQIEKIVEKPVTKYIEKPYPVPVHIPVPHPIAIPVEIKLPQHYPFDLNKYNPKPQALAQAYSAPVPKTVKPQHHHQLSQQQKYPVTKLVQVEIPKYFERQIPIYVNLNQQPKQNPYLYAPKYQIDWKNVVSCDLNHKQLNHGQHRFAKIPDYIGLVPPVAPTNLEYGNVNPNFKRKARNSFEQNLRIEYGFKPPIIPSVQTDEFGMPLNKEE